MSEYIIEWFDIGGQLANLLNGNMPLVLWPKKIREERLREKIVRCRDCKFCDNDKFAYWCCRERYREFKVDSLDGERMGFCSWGVKK